MKIGIYYHFGKKFFIFIIYREILLGISLYLVQRILHEIKLKLLFIVLLCRCFLLLELKVLFILFILCLFIDLFTYVFNVPLIVLISIISLILSVLIYKFTNNY